MRSRLAVMSPPARLAAVVAAGVLVLLLLGVGVTAVLRMAGGSAGAHAPIATPTPTAAATSDAAAAPQLLTPLQSAVAGSELARLRALAPVRRVPSSITKPVTAEDRRQPDLYARAFTAALLTQDYRLPRADLLAWVQVQSAQTTEPSVVGLVPQDLRDRWAVFTVIDAGDGPSPVPTAGDWTILGEHRGYTTVRIQRVIEPVAWSSAVASGRVTDPGVTAREVDALVTLHTIDAGRPQTTTTSVALTLNLEGPPTRADWGFVGAVTYTVVPAGTP